MSTNPACTVYIGNLDERVNDRILYDILIQAGRVVDLYIPRDKETERPKGFAFAEYETEEIADYAVGLFSGLVTLYNRTLKFAISGQDKPSLNLLNASTSMLNPTFRARPLPVPFNNMEASPHSTRLSTPCRVSEHRLNYAQVSPDVVHQPNGYRSQFDGNNYDYSRRVFGTTLDSFSHSRSSRYDRRDPAHNPYY